MNRKKREQLILDSAVRVFAHRGYPSTSVSDIINEANVARGTFYLYFKSKKDLFSALIDRFMLEISQDVTKISAFNGNPQIDLEKRYRILSSDLITTITRNKLLTKIILRDSLGLHSEFDAKLNMFYDQLVSIIQNNLGAQIKAGILRNCQTDVVARCMIGSVKEIITSWIISDALELESTIHGLIDYLLNGVSMTLPSIERQASDSDEQHLSRPNINNLH